MSSPTARSSSSSRSPFIPLQGPFSQEPFTNRNGLAAPAGSHGGAGSGKQRKGFLLLVSPHPEEESGRVGGLQAILDLRKVNQCMHCLRFRMETFASTSPSPSKLDRGSRLADACFPIRHPPGPQQVSDSRGRVSCQPSKYR